MGGGGRATACGYSFPPCKRAEGDKDSYLDSKIHQMDLIPNGPEKMGPKQPGRQKDFRGNQSSVLRPKERYVCGGGGSGGGGGLRLRTTYWDPHCLLCQATQLRQGPRAGLRPTAPGPGIPGLCAAGFGLTAPLQDDSAACRLTLRRAEASTGLSGWHFPKPSFCHKVGAQHMSQYTSREPQCNPAGNQGPEARPGRKTLSTSKKNV